MSTTTLTGDAEPLWDAKRVRTYLAVSDRWIRRAMSTGTFPTPDYRLSKTHGMRWRRSTIMAYLESRKTTEGTR